MNRGGEGRVLLRQAIELRDRVRASIAQGKFAGDDIQMKRYNQFIKAAANLFPEDPVLNGEMVAMPDATLQSFGTLFDVRQMPLDMPSRRLEERLVFLIDRLELVLGGCADESVQLSAPTELPMQRVGDRSQMVLDSVAELRSRPIELPPVDVRDFDFVASASLRQMLANDYVEAQRGYQVGAFKASTILSGSLLEGMLFDILHRTELVALAEYQAATANFAKKGPKDKQSIDWDKVSLAQLIGSAVKMRIIPESIGKMGEGLKDFRDAVHPNAELRNKARAQNEEAHLALSLVKLVYRYVSVFCKAL